MAGTQEKKKLDPENEIITVSAKKTVNFYVFISKIIMNKFQKVELQALGEAINKAIIIANDLVNAGIATYTKIEPTTQNIGVRGNPTKIVIQLQATDKLQKID